MSVTEKYQGIFPAFYACYEDDGSVSPQRARRLARYLLEKGVKGLYVGGSSGECITQSVQERKIILENVMDEVGDKLVIIAHVACNNTADSQELARHAQSLGVDAIAAIPPIYFHLPPYGIADYWNDISAAAPDTDFIIYNIPQLAGVALTQPLLEKMKENPRLIGVKNSSLPTMDIELWKEVGGGDFVVMNGPDEQFISGLAMGATGGIGGTYGAMPELFQHIFNCFRTGRMTEAAAAQYAVCHIIYTMLSAHGNLYAVIKEILRRRGVETGDVRKPLPSLVDSDKAVVDKVIEQIDTAIAKLC